MSSESVPRNSSANRLQAAWRLRADSTELVQDSRDIEELPECPFNDNGILVDSDVESEAAAQSEPEAAPWPEQDTADTTLHEIRIGKPIAITLPFGISAG